MKLPIDIETIKGFLDPVEGQALFDRCTEASTLGPCLEIGSYCGKSTLYMGTACKQLGRTLFALDHHRGSEEHQQGEEYHDPDLFDSRSGLMDSFFAFRSAMQKAELEDFVVPLVASSITAARDWQTPLGMVFIDGGHSLEAAMTDYECWSKHVIKGGILAIHDIFKHPDEGGQAPHIIWKKAIDSGLFDDLGVVRTLGVLRRNDN
ncbi:MAG: class I SAM-dependent methyltransferase [Pseudomonadales bacterium]|nr:class I SAM-dependent methyltransferase [Pseudomonadales bacterium]